MTSVPGTQGYARDVEHFVRATMAVDFVELHREFLPFVPKPPAHVLDIGAGCGRDAAALSSLGHDVVAVEPLPAFLAVARMRYASARITWIDDSLPGLAKLDQREYSFGFVLASAVWHHIDDLERPSAMRRIFELLAPGGIFAVSLRNGPAGLGTCVYSTDGAATVRIADAMGFTCRLNLPDQASLLPHKENVRWTKLVLQKRVARLT